ncbi:hypothetical protein [Peribacillus sp. TH14]|uniref:hypothetical protein n=1 Tax=Peribacillus sp. TH14 TaxID=2798481 RepID=UPI0019132A2E|nr:hypothetical protein [Peribacillus sp. TH14]MBK5502782.1 hypothetical protein [Peribacillus sp. TH14]
MDNTTIQNLAKVITGNWDEKKQDVKKEINSILKRKSIKRILFELNESIKTREISDKNKAVLITTIAFIRRDLDSKEEIGRLLNQYGMINQLYGGLIKLLDGKSETFKIDIEWSIRDHQNNFEFLYRFPAPEYWRFIDLIITASILKEFDSEKFERILLLDKTNLLLLNYIQGNIRWNPTQNLIVKLLNDQNTALRRSIGLFLLISPIERVTKKSGKLTKEDASILNNQVQNFIKIFEDLIFTYRTELLVNYFLHNKRSKSWPVFLAKLMINHELKECLIREIESEKVKFLDDILILLLIIRKNRVKESGNEGFKQSLYDAIIEKVKSFINTGTGIYKWDYQKEKEFEIICSLLSKKNKLKLKKFILKTHAELMISDLDELVRYDIYLKDKNKAEILNGMGKVITHNLKAN